jgi:AcrR family transcriptional regulator
MKATTRQRIRTAAMGLFAERGYAATPTQEICRRAGISKPVLYYHFQSKENLYREIILEACAEMQRALTVASYRGATAREKLIDVLTADFEHTMRNPGLSAMIFRMIFAPKREAPSIDYVRLGMDWVNLISGILREGLRRGEMSCRPREVAEAFLGVDTIYSISYLVRGEPKLDRRLAKRIVRLLVDGCTPNCTDR